MNLEHFIEKLKNIGTNVVIWSKEKWKTNRAASIAVVSFLFLVIIYSFSSSNESNIKLYNVDKDLDFSKGRILGTNEDSFYRGKERLLNKTTRDVLQKQSELLDKIKGLETKLTELNKERKPSQLEGVPNDIGSYPPLTTFPSDPNIKPEAIEPEKRDNGEKQKEVKAKKVKPKKFVKFPIRKKKVKKTKYGLVIPTGSYSLGTALTGLDTPDKRLDPVLIQLDHEFVGPNDSRMDLTGCFMIAKATPSRSTERMDYQATKLSCVNKSGEFFERKINGFVQSNSDHVLGIQAEVRSNQNRVAAMAFLSSVVQGVGSALQQAQTTQQTTALGGSQSVVTGNQAKYMVGGGAANAAGRVADWYLKETSQLLPTFRVGAGEKVWIVLKDKVRLPEEFFNLKNHDKGEKHGLHDYFTRVLD